MHTGVERTHASLAQPVIPDLLADVPRQPAEQPDPATAEPSAEESASRVPKPASAPERQPQTEAKPSQQSPEQQAESASSSAAQPGLPEARSAQQEPEQASTSGRQPQFRAWQDPIARSEAFQQLEDLMLQRIIFIDGAMGTAIQAYGLQEDDYRGDR